MSEPVPGPYRLRPNPDHDSPETRRFCAAAQDLLNAEFEERSRNLMIYGTTHPEMLPGFEV